MKKIHLIIFLFLTFTAYNQISFQEIPITTVSFSPQDPVFISSADLDNDGDIDLISASTFDNKIAWYENTDGNGNYSSPTIITNSQSDGAIAVYASDLDSDGDLDILAASLYDNDIAWYENTDGKGNFSAQKIISIEGVNARSVYTSDMDGDGDMDVLSASNNNIAWYENIDGKGNFSAQKIISTLIIGGYSVKASDIDNDGDLDVVSSSAFDNKIAWYENIDGKGSFSAQKVITSNVGWVYSISMSDLDNDGDNDISYTSLSDNKIGWFENTDGKGTFISKQIITTNINQPKFIFNADMDNDEDIDLLYISDNRVSWFENRSGTGNFSEEHVILSNYLGDTNSIIATDVDGDNDYDVVFDAGNNFILYNNIDGKGNFDNKKELINSTSEARSVIATDIDSDGDLDLLTSSSEDDKISWFENEDGLGTFIKQRIIAYTNGAVNAISGDIDGDGDQDIVATGHNSNRTFWQENLDGKGNFGTPKTIVTGTSFNTSIYLSDIDGDGDLDLVSDASWYENTDGKGNFGSKNVIGFSLSQLYYTYASDIDGDGDKDILTASAFANKIAWYENEDGKGNFSTEKIISTSASDASYVISADLDNDGDNDVISGSFGDKKIAWYENMDGLGTFGAQQIITTETSGAITLFTSDLDNDGDIDILSASPGDNKIAWYENEDGKGNFSEQKIISTNALGAVDVITADINNDGKLDILSASFTDGKIAWYKNTSTILSTNKFRENNISIYPNPTRKKIVFNTPLNVSDLKIHDLLGKEIKYSSFLNNQVDVSNLSKGIYILTFRFNGAFKSIKFIKN